MFQAGLVVAAPKLIFDMGANKHKYWADGSTGEITEETVIAYMRKLAENVYDGPNLILSTTMQARIFGQGYCTFELSKPVYMGIISD